jgi:hypothetical protein
MPRDHEEDEAMRARWIPSAAILTFVAFAATASIAIAAAELEDMCEAKKLKITGLYSSCRLKAEGEAKLQGTAPDYTKCEETFAKKFGKAEEKAGPGVCPSEGDQEVIDGAVAGYTAELAMLLAGPTGCPQADQSRTPIQVVLDLRAAAAAEDWAAFGCRASHTYLILGGRIRQQTTHGLINFNGPPPEDL